MMDEEALPKKKRLLEDMSIEELTERIASLTEEIEACRAAIAKKEASRKAAEAAFFKS